MKLLRVQVFASKNPKSKWLESVVACHLRNVQILLSKLHHPVQLPPQSAPRLILKDQTTIGSLIPCEGA